MSDEVSMKVPEHFLNFDEINTIRNGPDEILYRLEDALQTTGVMAGRTNQTSIYHRDKVINTFGPFAKVRVTKRRKNEAGVLALHYYEREANTDGEQESSETVRYAPPGTYVPRQLLYKLLFLSNLQANQQVVEQIETEVTPSIYESGFFVCDGLSPDQIQNLRNLVSAL